MSLARVILPWSKTSDFSQNARVHWAARHRRVKAQKDTTTILAKQAGWHKVNLPEAGRIVLRVTLCPPPRGPFPDDDNALSANKGALDALAAVLGVDDRRFRPVVERGERSKHGAVIVTMEAVE